MAQTTLKCAYEVEANTATALVSSLRAVSPCSHVPLRVLLSRSARDLDFRRAGTGELRPRASGRGG